MSGSSGQGGSGPTKPCPDDMVDVVAQKNGTDYCIDRDEATNADYADFLTIASGGVDPGDVSPDCDSPPNLTPEGWPASALMQPVSGVSWCQAYVFCQVLGKRLCGDIATGSANEFSTDAVDPDKDEWVNACEGPQRHPFPYGSFDSSRCNTVGAPGAGPDDIETFPMCTGGASANLHDMSGSIREWSNSCDSTPADKSLQYCHVRGGSFVEGNPMTSASCAADGNEKRTAHYNDVGIRCCKPASH